MAQVRLEQTGTLVDASLREIEAYLSERLDHVPAAAATAMTNLILDVRMLDLHDTARTTADGRHEWAGHDVYAVRAHRSAIIVGPRWTHGEPGPCPCCLSRRWRAIRAAEEIEALDNGRERYAIGRLPGLTPFTLATLWTIIERTLLPPAAATPVPANHVVEINFNTLAVREHLLVADSLCPVCAEPEPDGPQTAVIDLVSQHKTSVTSYRLTPASAYPFPIEGYANPVCGVFAPRIVNNYHVSATAPAAGSWRERSKSGVHDVRWGGHATTYTSSTHLGLLEALERYAGLQPRSRFSTVYDSYDNLASDALDPLSYGVYSDEFYQAFGRHYRAYAPDQLMHWVWGYSLREKRSILVPEQLVYYLDRREEYPNFIQECSNGCASGSCLEEATLFGLLEVIERDAFLLCWYGRVRPPEIDIATCRDPRTHAMAERLDLLGYDTHLFDMRVDVPVPAVMMVARRRDGGLGNLCFSAGADLDPERAVAAALQEAASYVSDLVPRVKLIEPQLLAMTEDYRKVTDLVHHSVLFGLPQMSPHADFLFGEESSTRPPAAMDEVYASWLARRPDTLDLRDDLECCLELIFGLDMDVIVVDQTCPEQRAVGVRTACVIVPGMLPIDFGWLRQRALHLPRLRTAFRTAGSRDTDLALDDLHLHPHPFP